MLDAKRLLAALPEAVAAQAQADLQRRGIDVRTGVKVTGVTASSTATAIPAR